jgi:hypothetical protein
MANTTNYNWETPDDTDLVKDGAAAIRTLGSSVDTTTKALNPSTTLGDIEYRSATANTNTRLPIGTTGQILSVVAGVPAWVANDVGDITAVTAGTGISGGGTTGDVTITNSMATEITAAGDIIVGTGSGTFDNLPIGTTNQVLTADTTVSPYKVKWATPSSSTPTFIGCSIRGAANLTQSISNVTTTVVNFDAEDFDTDGFHSNVTNNSRITIPAGKTGYYQINYLARFASNSTGYRAIYPYKNGAVFSPSVQSVVQTSGTSSHSTGISIIAYLVATDYIELAVEQNSGGSLNLLVDNTRLSIGFLGA